MTMEMRTRAEGSAAQERRMSRAVVAPFVGAVNAWQKQLVRLRALRNGERATPQQRIAASKDIEGLLASVMALHTEFEAATLGDRSSRKLDLGRSLRRLTEMARSAGGSESHD